MLDFLGWNSEGEALRSAVRSALQENFVTPDLGGDKGTVEVGDWIAKSVGSR
jgi:isocitrate/isopropylmalate dehydrogenase